MPPPRKFNVPVGQDEVHGTFWPPKGGRGKRPLVILIHGLGSSRTEWYDFPKALSDQSYAVAAFDARGHGQSTGQRGVLSIHRVREDVGSVIEKVTGYARVDGERIALVGHSLGGAFALHLAPDVPNVRSVVAMAPPWRLGKEVGLVERAGYFAADKVNRLLRLVKPEGMSVPYAIDYTQLYASRAAVKRAEKDQFLQGRVSLNNYKPLMKQVDAVAAAQRVHLPTLVLIAELDLVVGPWNSRKVFGSLGSPKKKLVTLEGSGHSIPGDHKWEEAVDETARWLAENLDGA